MDITRGLPKLKGEQCDILYLPRHSNQVILGVAGSGKSIEAICRAAWIGMTDPDSGDKVIVLSFNKDVNEEISQKLKFAVDGHKNNITVRTIYSYCKHLINKYAPKKGSMLDKLKNSDWNLYAISAKNDKKALKDAIQAVHENEPSSSLWNKTKYPDFISSEIEWMQSNEIPYNNKQIYLAAHRIDEIMKISLKIKEIPCIVFIKNIIIFVFINLVSYLILWIYIVLFLI